MKLKIFLFLFTCFFILTISCEKESALEEYYGKEGNFSGSIYDGLDSTGMYKTFLEAIDSTFMANQLKNTLVTVVAPSDKAFKAYLEKHGYNNLSDVPLNELEDLIGHHVITWPHSPSAFKEEPVSFKRRTNMASSTVVKYDAITNTNKTILSETKYLQFFFPEMLSYYGATENDYTLLTGSKLSESTGFNIYNVPVDSIAPFGNGWVYYVDQVVEPVQNLDDWLMNSSDHSLFSYLFSRFSKYTTDKPAKKRNDLYQFQHQYRVDFELAYEPVYFNSLGGTGVEYQLKSRSAFNVFAPKNDALEAFIDEYFKDYPGFKDSIRVIDFSSLDNLHINKIVRAMIIPYMQLEQTILPSKIFSAEGILGADKTVLNFKEEDIAGYNLCSNGFGYELNRYEVPRTFKSVLKPAFTTPEYKYFAAIIEATKSTAFLNSLDANFTLFIPTDQAFINAGLLLVDPLTANSEYGQTLDPLIGNSVFLNLNLAAPTPMTGQLLFPYLFNHILTENVIISDQTQYVTNSLGGYVGISKEKAWSGGNINNTEGIKTIANIVKNFPDGSFDNGSVYVIDELIKSPVLSIGDIIKSNPAFSRFKDLCSKAELLGSNGILQIFGDNPTVFIPTNEALDKFIAEGNEPSDLELLQDFVRYFFVNKPMFTTETINETANTLSVDKLLSTEFKTVYKNAEINGTYGNYKVKGVNNTSFLNVIEGATSNIICTDGIIHQIDGVLN